MQNNLQKFVRQENDTVGKMLSVQFQLINYQRGWFSSSAVFQMNHVSDGQITSSQKIPLEIHHGPSYFDHGRWHIGVGMVSADNVSLEPGLPFLLSWRSEIQIGGLLNTVILLSPSPSGADLPLTTKSVVLHIQNDLDANHFRFTLLGDGLQYRDPNNLLTLTIQQMKAKLNADFLGKQHWVFTIGLQLDDNTALFGSNSALRISHFSLNRLHVDTQSMAQWLKDVIQVRQASEQVQSVSPASLISLLQTLVTQTMSADTTIDLSQVALTTPMGELQGSYHLGFPTLQKTHDYFDVATRHVSVLRVDVPRWLFQDPQDKQEFNLVHFSYHYDSNTIFSQQSLMSFDSFDVHSLSPTIGASSIDAAGFSYRGSTSGDINQLTQNMQWQLAKLCVSSDCMRNINLQAQLANLNFAAFRDIAANVQTLVQSNTDDAQARVAEVMNVANSYQKLISPTTAVTLSENMQTPNGPVTAQGKVWWDATATPPLFNNASYQVDLAFPTKYATDFIAAHGRLPAATPTPTSATSVPASPDTMDFKIAEFLQQSIHQGYLKQSGDAYVMSLQGKGNQATINGVAVN